MQFIFSPFIIYGLYALVAVTKWLFAILNSYHLPSTINNNLEKNNILENFEPDCISWAPATLFCNDPVCRFSRPKARWIDIFQAAQIALWAIRKP